MVKLTHLPSQFALLKKNQSAKMKNPCSLFIGSFIIDFYVQGLTLLVDVFSPFRMLSWTEDKKKHGLCQSWAQKNIKIYKLRLSKV